MESIPIQARERTPRADSEPEAEPAAERYLPETVCPFCHDAIPRGIEPGVCAGCHALHHKPCLRENGGACAACGWVREALARRPGSPSARLSAVRTGSVQLDDLRSENLLIVQPGFYFRGTVVAVLTTLGVCFADGPAEAFFSSARGYAVAAVTFLACMLVVMIAGQILGAGLVRIEPDEE